MALDKAVYEKVLHEFEDRRLENSYRQRQRLLEVYEKNPRIAYIDQEMTRAGSETMITILNSPEKKQQALDEMLALNNELKNERISELNKMGLGADYTEIHYNCPVCKDRGFIENKMCGCFLKSAAKQAKKMSELASVLEKQKFETFDMEVFSKEPCGDALSPYENMKDILKSIRAYTDNFSSDSTNLYLYGDVGTGKTFLASCIANALIDKGINVVYRSAPGLFQDYFNMIFNRENALEASEKIKSAENSELLIIDDIGAEAQNAQISAYLFNIIDSRIIANKKTIITTNLTFGEIDRIYSSRVSSRLFENFTLIKCIGEDLRYRSMKNL